MEIIESKISQRIVRDLLGIFQEKYISNFIQIMNCEIKKAEHIYNEDANIKGITQHL